MKTLKLKGIISSFKIAILVHKSTCQFIRVINLAFYGEGQKGDESQSSHRKNCLYVNVKTKKAAEAALLLLKQDY